MIIYLGLENDTENLIEISKIFDDNCNSKRKDNVTKYHGFVDTFKYLHVFDHTKHSLQSVSLNLKLIIRRIS